MIATSLNSPMPNMPNGRNVAPSRRRIGLLHLGAPSNVTPERFRAWVASLPELNIIADLTPLSVDCPASSDLTPAMLTAVASAIERRYEHADGFVILHDIDNLLYTGAALSFSLAGLRKAVVLTGGNVSAAPGAMRDPTQLAVGVKANLINAVQVATLPIPEVAILFGNRLLRANQAFPVATGGMNFFDAPPSGVLGRIDFSIRLAERNIRPPSTAKLERLPLSGRVGLATLTPWLNRRTLLQQLDAVDALLLDARGYQALPRWLHALLAGETAGKAVAVFSPTAAVPLGGRQVCLIPRGSREAMLAKLAWAVSVSKSPVKVVALMTQNIAGELGL